MRTAEEWLAIPEDKLGVELAKLRTPGPWKHSTPNRSGGRCYKCGTITDDWDSAIEGSGCPVPDAININDWNVAMEWFRQHNPSRTILRQVCGPHPIDCITWFLAIAQPKHYLIAAAMAAV